MTVKPFPPVKGIEFSVIIEQHQIVRVYVTVLTAHKPCFIGIELEAEMGTEPNSVLSIHCAGNRAFTHPGEIVLHGTVFKKTFIGGDPQGAAGIMVQHIDIGSHHAFPSLHHECTEFSVPVFIEAETRANPKRPAVIVHGRNGTLRKPVLYADLLAIEAICP
jgi:hypothetical protein